MSTAQNHIARAETLALDARSLAEALAATPPAAGWEDGERDPMKRVEVRAGVGIVRVQGLLAAESWWCESYPEIVERASAALASPQVRAVVLAVSSPGGDVAGLFDAMRRLRAAKTAAGKRMVAFVGSQATSAGYALASLADEIVVDEVALVGSIGCISTILSRSEQLKEEGIDVRVVTSGAEKAFGHPAVPITDAAVARVRERVDAAAEMLITEIAASRPSLVAEQQRALDGGVRQGRAAVAAGLADRIGTLESVLASLAVATNPFASPNRASAPAAQAAALTTRTIMHETMAALIAAKTGETDPERQLGALQALLAKAEGYDALRAEAEKVKAEAEAEAFERELTAGLAARKLSDEEALWWRAERAEGRATAASLGANLKHRAAPTLAAAAEAHRDVRPPKDEARTAPPDTRLAGLLAKPYAALTWDERNLLSQLDPENFDRLHSAWVAAGRPAA